MNLPRIELHEVGKQFTIRENATVTLKDGLIQLLSKGRIQQNSETFWALKDINLKVYDGEVVGLVGHNGAGKSTLLRLVAHIMTPTTGEVIVRGRVTPLLSLGLGFHPDLTGRENIYLDTSFYGITRAHTDEIYHDIVDFSELGRFIDSPVKNYSSGMRMRLGFSIAVHLDPDILIIDEVLAAGDSEFQKKSSKKMLDLIRGGKTVMLITHNMGLIQEVCNRVYLLAQGQIAAEGDPREVIEQYQGHA